MLPQQKSNRDSTVLGTVPRSPVIGMSVQTFPCWVDTEEIQRRASGRLGNAEVRFAYEKSTTGSTDHHGICAGYPVYCMQRSSGKVGALQTLNGLRFSTEKVRTEKDLMRAMRFLGVAHSEVRNRKVDRFMSVKSNAFDVAYFGKVTIMNYTFTPPQRQIGEGKLLLRTSCKPKSVTAGDILTMGVFPFDTTVSERDTMNASKECIADLAAYHPSDAKYFSYWYENLGGRMRNNERMVPIWYSAEDLDENAIYDTVLDYASENKKNLTVDNELKEFTEGFKKKSGECARMLRRAHFKVLGDPSGNAVVPFGKEMVGVVTMCGAK